MAFANPLLLDLDGGAWVPRVAVKLVTLALVATARIAAADELDPCRDAILDPVATPVRDAAIDAQRGACLRDELGAACSRAR